MSFPIKCVLASQLNLFAVNFLKGSFLLLVFALASCSPRHGLAERGSHVATAHVDNTSHVSRDSIIVQEKVRFVKINDTIFRDSIVVVTKIASKTDTILRIDSVLISDTISVVKFRDPRSSFQKATDKAGNVCLLVIFIIILVKLLKLKRHD